MLSISIFPVEIIINILSRLPAKSIGICRCVCKPWRSLLSQPHFIKTHPEFIKKLQEPSLIFVSGSGSLYFISFDNAHHLLDEIPESAKKLSFADHPGTWDNIIASCDGLVLVTRAIREVPRSPFALTSCLSLSDNQDKIFLINPVTRQIREVPHSLFALTSCLSFTMYGLGYDSVNDDYKIVTLSYDNIDYIERRSDDIDCTEMLVNVYSIKNGTWKKAESSPYDHGVGRVTSGVFVNGCIHWLASKTTSYSSVIAAFDLAQEKFYEVPPPNSIRGFVLDSLVELGGCLCLCRTNFNRGTDVWVMEEYANKESWTKFINIDPGSQFRPLCMLGREQVVLVKEQMVLLRGSKIFVEKLVKYSLIDGSFNDIVVDGISVKFPPVGIFVESLASPHCSHETS